MWLWSISLLRNIYNYFSEEIPYYIMRWYCYRQVYLKDHIQFYDFIVINYLSNINLLQYGKFISLTVSIFNDVIE